MVCNWHLQDTRWGDDPKGVVVHSLVITINENEFCMIDYTVNAASNQKYEWTEESVQKAIAFCKPILMAMNVKGNLRIKGIEFPETDFRV
jgi:hypothetical protein